MECLGELVKVAASLGENDIDGHGVSERVEVDGEFVYTHLLVQRPLPVHGHDGHTDEEVEGVGGVVGPTGLPHAQSVLQFELPLQADQQPSVSVEEREAVL